MCYNLHLLRMLTENFYMRGLYIYVVANMMSYLQATKSGSFYLYIKVSQDLLLLYLPLGLYMYLNYICQHNTV